MKIGLLLLLTLFAFAACATPATPVQPETKVFKHMQNPDFLRSLNDQALVDTYYKMKAGNMLIPGPDGNVYRAYWTYEALAPARAILKERGLEPKEWKTAITSSPAAPPPPAPIPLENYETMRLSVVVEKYYWLNQADNVDEAQIAAARDRLIQLGLTATETECNVLMDDGVYVGYNEYESPRKSAVPKVEIINGRPVVTSIDLGLSPLVHGMNYYDVKNRSYGCYFYKGYFYDLSAASDVLTKLEDALVNDGVRRDDLDRIRRGEVSIGMPRAGVYAALGWPEEINRTTTAHLVHEQLIYKDGDLLVYLENGKVTAWQD